MKEAVIQSNLAASFIQDFTAPSTLPQNLPRTFPAFSLRFMCPRQASLIHRAHPTSPQHRPALRALSLAARQPFE